MNIDVILGLDESVTTPVKRNKGKSLLNIRNDYTVIDLETTGLNPAFDSIIEVACIKYRDGKEVDAYHSYVQPPAFYEDDEDGQEHSYYVDDFITDLTGITNEMLETSPTFDKIADGLYSFLGSDILVGHNVNFDINFLYDNFAECYKPDFSNDFIDTMRLARLILPELPHHRLTDLVEHFSISGNHHHRAMHDCNIAHDVLIQLGELIVEKNINLEKYLASRRKYDLTKLTCTQDIDAIDKTHIFYDKNCVFTGKLERFHRKDAAQIVVNIGGHCENSVTKKTNFLIIGELKAPTIKGNKSTKMKKAESFILAGQDLKILSEDTFYDLIEDL